MSLVNITTSPTFAQHSSTHDTTKQATGLDQALTAASDPNYAGPQLPVQQFVLDLPWWFFGAQQAGVAPSPPPAAAPAEPATPPAVGVPPAGPYTVSEMVNEGGRVVAKGVRQGVRGL